MIIVRQRMYSDLEEQREFNSQEAKRINNNMWLSQKPTKVYVDGLKVDPVSEAYGELEGMRRAGKYKVELSEQAARKHAARHYGNFNTTTTANSYYAPSKNSSVIERIHGRGVTGAENYNKELLENIRKSPSYKIKKKVGSFLEKTGNVVKKRAMR